MGKSTMQKTYLPGTTFMFRDKELVTLEAVNNTPGDECQGCALHEYCVNSIDVRLNCDKESRRDGKNVIFAIVGEGEKGDEKE